MAQAEEAFLMARALGWLERAENLHTHQKEVRFELDGDIGQEELVLGKDWEEARDKFVKGAISKRANHDAVTRARKILTQRMRELVRDCSVNEAKSAEVKTAIKRFNKERSDEYPAHRFDPRYQRDIGIFNRIQGAMDGTVEGV